MLCAVGDVDHRTYADIRTISLCVDHKWFEAIGDLAPCTIVFPGQTVGTCRFSRGYGHHKAWISCSSIHLSECPLQYILWTSTLKWRRWEVRPRWSSCTHSEILMPIVSQCHQFYGNLQAGALSDGIWKVNTTAHPGCIAICIYMLYI